MIKQTEKVYQDRRKKGGGFIVNLRKLTVNPCFNYFELDNKIILDGIVYTCIEVRYDVYRGINYYFFI